MEKDIRTTSRSIKPAERREPYWDAHKFDIGGIMNSADLGLRIGAFGKARLYRLTKRIKKGSSVNRIETGDENWLPDKGREKNGREGGGGGERHGKEHYTIHKDFLGGSLPLR